MYRRTSQFYNFSVLHECLLAAMWEGDSEEGCHIDFMKSQLSPIPPEKVIHGLKFLAEEGHVYSTIDDQHYKAVDGCDFLLFTYRIKSDKRPQIRDINRTTTVDVFQNRLASPPLAWLSYVELWTEFLDPQLYEQIIHQIHLSISTLPNALLSMIVSYLHIKAKSKVPTHISFDKSMQGVLGQYQLKKSHFLPDLFGYRRVVCPCILAQGGSAMATTEYTTLCQLISSRGGSPCGPMPDDPQEGIDLLDDFIQWTGIGASESILAALGLVKAGLTLKWAGEHGFYGKFFHLF